MANALETKYTMTGRAPLWHDQVMEDSLVRCSQKIDWDQKHHVQSKLKGILMFEK